MAAHVIPPQRSHALPDHRKRLRMNRLALAALVALSACTCPAPPVAVAPAPAPEKQALRLRSGQASGEVSLLARGPYTAGLDASVAFTVTAKPGFHVNPEYPMVFKPQGHSGVAFASERLKLAWAAKTPCQDRADQACAVEVMIPLVPQEAGKAVVAGLVAFSVCNLQGCQIEKLPVSLDIDVK